MLIRRNEAIKHKIITAENGIVSKPFNVFTVLAPPLKAP
jgi:hypothetical protein